MSVLLLILGFILLAIVSFDVLITTLTIKGGGFLTNRLSSWVWQGAIKLHYIKPNHNLLSGVGSFLIAAMVIFWFLLTWASWVLIFSSFDNAILNSSDHQPASIWGRIYFTIYTITTLGRGDYLPGGVLWHLLTGLAAANGFFLVTLSIAYLFPVVSALTEQRTLAVYLAALGGTADEILTRAWNGRNFGNLDQHLISLTPLIAQLAEKHLTYPILYYFHSREQSRAFSLSLAALDEAITLLQYAVSPDCRPEPTSVNTVRRTIASFLKTFKSAYLKPLSQEPPLIVLSLLQDKGIPTVDYSQFIKAIAPIRRRRCLLLSLVVNDGWSWDSIMSSNTSTRANNLDDETPITTLNKQ